MSIACKAQLDVKSVAGITPEQLVKKYLVGEGVEIRNVKFNGTAAPFDSTGQIAVFYTGVNVTGLGFETGIIISSGLASNVVGPNVDDKLSTNKKANLGLVGDVTLDKLLPNGQKTLDAGVLEFEFKATQENISFNYIFASEEYPEYVNDTIGDSDTIFNDVFGFFVTTSNFIEKNIAIIPDTSVIIPISIDNVNYGHNQWQYIAAKGKNTKYFRSNSPISLVGKTILNTYLSADGLTDTLSASVDVLPCEWSYIKIAVADVGDQRYDSWVFLKANSFKVEKPKIGFINKPINIDVPKEDTVLVRDCKNSTLKLEWGSFTNRERKFNVYYKGTAVKDVDYRVVLKDAKGNETADSNFILLKDSTFATMEIIPLTDDTNLTDKYLDVIISTNFCTNKEFDTVQFTLLNYAVPNVKMLGDTIICQANLPVTLPLGVETNEKYGNLKYKWSTGDTNAFTTVNFTDTVSKIYYLTITNGCFTYFDSVIVRVIPDIDINIVSSAIKICKGDSITLDVFTSDTINTPQYIWEIGNSDINIQLDNQNSHVVLSPSFTNNYLLTIKDSFNCTYQDSIHIKVYDPQVNLGNDTTMCIKEVMTLKAPANYEYLWSTDEVSQIINVNKSGEYWVKITDKESGCNDADTINIVVFPLPNVTVAISEDTICPLDSITLTTGGADTYYWTSKLTEKQLKEQENNQVVVLNPSKTNEYTVTGTTNKGCKSSNSILLFVKPSPVAYFTANPNPVLQLEPFVRFKTSAQGTISYKWDLGDGTFSDKLDFIYKYATDTATYLVTLEVENESGCKSFGHQYIKVIPDVTIYIPNAFIPDDANPKLNKFKVYGLNLPNFELYIFDRWGKQIFYSKDPNEGWDGTYRGEKQNRGVYTYLVRYKDAYGALKDKKGTLTLIR